MQCGHKNKKNGIAQRSNSHCLQAYEISWCGSNAHVPHSFQSNPPKTTKAELSTRKRSTQLACSYASNIKVFLSPSKLTSEISCENTLVRSQWYIILKGSLHILITLVESLLYMDIFNFPLCKLKYPLVTQKFRGPDTTCRVVRITQRSPPNIWLPWVSITLKGKNICGKWMSDNEK